jgi:hypothetical protein
VTDEELQRRSETAHSELYISLGRCTVRLQFLELALTQLLAVIAVTDKTGEDATPRRLRLDTAQQGFRRKTLGQLVGEIQNLSASPSSPLTDEFREQVRQLNKKRIWAIHSCTDEIDEQIVDDDTRHAFCKRIDEVTFDAGQLQERIATLMADYLSRQGVDVDGARQLANARIKKAMGVSFDT